MRCPKCGYENKEGVAVCNGCAALLPGTEASGFRRKEDAPPEGPAPALELQRADLRAVCTDPELQLRFASLSEEMSGNGFQQFLDYTVPQFGRGNFTRAFCQPDVPAYGGVVYLAGDGRPQVYAELVTPFDNGATLTTANAALRSWPISRPPEHLLFVETGADVTGLLSIHRRRMSVLSDSGANPLPCTPEEYRAHLARHYQESLTFATRGRTTGQFTGEGPGCAALLAALVGLGAAVALLLGR